ncbi:MAG: O-antigen ligase family protein, partial [Armatimonadetes bacterium]|nr:O-antigen ligase family protein [Anaerolineae bacterium]
FMGLLAPLAFAAATGYAVRGWRLYRHTRQRPWINIVQTLFYAAAFALISSGVVLSWSRGAWLALGVALLVTVLLIPRKVWQSCVLLLMLLVLVGGLALSGRLPATITDRIASASQELFAFDDVRGVDINSVNYAVVERLAHWQAALNMGRSHWWLGVGFGNYENAYDQHRLLYWHEALGHAHNYYLNIFAETGMMGVTTYVIMWVSNLWFTWRIRSHPDPLARLISIGLFGTWTYLAVHSLTDNLYVNNVFIHLGVMLGIIAVLYSQTWQSIKQTKL